MKKQHITYKTGQNIACTGLWEVSEMEDDCPIYYDCPKNGLTEVESTLGVAKRIDAQGVEIIVCPRFTLDDTVHWFRETVGIHIEMKSADKRKWSYELVDICQSQIIKESDDDLSIFEKFAKEGYPVFDTYEDAVKDAIDKAVSIFFNDDDTTEESEPMMMSEEEYARFCENAENMDVYDGRGTYDLYECEDCNHYIITTYDVKGVTPFVIKCPKCEGAMKHTATYKNVFPTTKVLRWVRPTYEQFLSLSSFSRQHVIDGGLILETMLPQKTTTVNIGTIGIGHGFGKKFIEAIATFCTGISHSAMEFAEYVINIGNNIDRALGNEQGFAAGTIMDILTSSNKQKEVARNLIAMYGLKGMGMFFQRYFPVTIYAQESLQRVYELVNTYNDNYITNDINPPKPYVGYTDPKHRLPCKSITGFKRQNHWKRTRSNPKLR